MVTLPALRTLVARSSNAHATKVLYTPFLYKLLKVIFFTVVGLGASLHY